METTFYNVTITVDAPTAAEAYTALCNALATAPGIDWQTDTYMRANVDTFGRDVAELFPAENPPDAIGRAIEALHLPKGSPCK